MTHELHDYSNHHPAPGFPSHATGPLAATPADRILSLHPAASRSRGSVAPRRPLCPSSLPPRRHQRIIRPPIRKQPPQAARLRPAKAAAIVVSPGSFRCRATARPHCQNQISRTLRRQRSTRNCRARPSTPRVAVLALHSVGEESEPLAGATATAPSGSPRR